MRLAKVAAALLIAVLVPSTSSQLPTAALLTDPMGDVRIDTDAQSVSAAGFGPLDLTELVVTEEPTTFQFVLSVVDLGDDQATDPQSGYHFIRFTYDAYDFMVVAFRPLDSSARGDLFVRENATAPFRLITAIPVFRNAAADTLGALVDRSLVVGSTGKVPGRGEELTNVFVTSAHRVEYLYGATGQPSPVQVADSMPDDLSMATSWTVQFGGRAGQGAELTSVEPFRASNGEETTYRYVVNLKHLGSINAFYEVSMDSVPDGWNVTLPGDLLAIDAGQTVDFPVYVSTPFRHQHGATESATLRVQQPYGDAWATIELGVHYLDIPQPAGHHAVQYFHNHPMTEAIGRINSACGGITGQILMNAVVEDATAQDAPVYGRSNCRDPADAVHWGVCLQPQLRLGLDFDTGAVGQVSVPITTSKAMPGAGLTGQLLLLLPGSDLSYCAPDYWADDNQTVLATFEAARTDLPANAETLVTANLVPTLDSDYIAYQTGMMLVMAIELDSDSPFGALAGPGMGTGGSLRLPLLEYHDTREVQAKGEEDVTDATFTSAAPVGKDSPGLAPISALLVIAIGLARRRMTQ